MEQGKKERRKEMREIMKKLDVKDMNDINELFNTKQYTRKPRYRSVSYSDTQQHKICQLQRHLCIILHFMVIFSNCYSTKLPFCMIVVIKPRTEQFMFCS